MLRRTRQRAQSPIASRILSSRRTAIRLESFEPKRVSSFELRLSGINKAGDLRPHLEQVLTRYHIEHSLRTQADDALSYDVKVPFEVETERVTNAVLKLDTTDGTTVEWTEKKVKTP